MGGSSWGHKGGVLGAVPLKRKTPGFLALRFFCLGFLCGCVRIWVVVSASGCACWCCACLVSVVGLVGGFGFSGGVVFVHRWFPEIPFATLLSSFIDDLVSLLRLLLLLFQIHCLYNNVQ